MKTPVRALCVVGSMNMGGAETQIMKLYRMLDKEKYQMDFLVHIQTDGYYDFEILSLGGNIYKTSSKSKHLLKSLYDLRRIMKLNDYKNILILAPNAFSLIDILAVKMSKNSNIVVRSSTSRYNGGFPGRIIHFIFQIALYMISIKRIAPSKKAGQFLFAGRETYILKNSIQTQDFHFDIIKRQQIRNKLVASDKFIIGHIGRFEIPKNHEFILEIFKSLIHRRPNCELWLIGNGSLKKHIMEYAKELEIIENIRFLGIQNNIIPFLMAMDIFLFPSIYEGLPNSLVEAQAAGLPCFISDSITSEISITDLIHILPLQAGSDIWANQILNAVIPDNREKYASIIKTAGYDTQDVMKQFLQLLYNE